MGTEKRRLCREWRPGRQPPSRVIPRYLREDPAGFAGVAAITFLVALAVDVLGILAGVGLYTVTRWAGWWVE